MIELESEKRLNDIKHSIETATGESYNDLTEAVQYLTEQFKTILEMKSVTFGVNNSKTKKVVLNCKGLKNLGNAFYNCGSLTEVHLTNTQGVFTWSQTFYDNRIHTIETLDLSNADKDIIGNSNWKWIQTPYLENLKIVPETIHNSITFVWCTKLTAESTQSIFDGLAIVTTAQTLTLPPNLKILQSQVDDANAKGWTVAGGTIVSEVEYYG